MVALLHTLYSKAEKYALEYNIIKGVRKMEEKELYNEALKKVNDLIKRAIRECENVAYQYDFEKDWIIDRFSENFNKVRKSMMKND